MLPSDRFKLWKFNHQHEINSLKAFLKWGGIATGIYVLGIAIICGIIYLIDHPQHFDTVTWIILGITAINLTVYAISSARGY